MNFKDFCCGILILFFGVLCLGAMGGCIYLHIQRERAEIELYKAAARGEAGGVTIVNGNVRNK